MTGARVEPRGRVVLGFDGSPFSLAALRWAAAQARARDMDLEIVTCWPDHKALFVREAPGHVSAPRHRAVLELEHALEVAADDLEGLDVVTVVENAHPVEALVQRCTHRDLLVVGASTPRADPDHIGVDRLCSLLAPCPIVVVGSAAVSLPV